MTIIKDRKILSILIISMLVVGTITGCTKKNENNSNDSGMLGSPTNENSFIDQSKLDSLNSEVQMDFLGDENSDDIIGVPMANNIETYIGYGINVLDATGANPENLKAPLFIPDVYQKNGYIDVTKANKAATASYASEYFTDVFKSSEVSAKLESGKALAFFTGKVEAKYGNSDKVTQSAKYYNATASVETEKHTLSSDYSMASDMQEVVKPKVLAKLNDPTISPEQIFDIYGTHIITDASIGGCIDIGGVYNSTEVVSKTDFQSSLDLACAYASASADVKLSEQQKKIINNTTIRAQSYGGNVSIVAGTHGLDEIAMSFKDWAASILKKDDQVLSKVYSYMPIWELATSDSRKTELKNTFYKLGEERFDFISKYFPLIPPTAPTIPVALSLPEVKDINKKTTLATLGFNPSISTVSSYFKDVAFPQSPAISNLNTLYMYTNSDNSVSFMSKVNESFLTVHVNSVNNSVKNADIKQLYFNSKTIGERQKFIMEKSGSGYKLKSVSSGKYIRFSYVEPTNLKQPTACFLADATQNDAQVFELIKL